MSGVYRVRTTSGASYVLDLTRRTFSRERGLTDFSAKLRRDSEEAILREVVQCEVGASMVLLIDLSWPGVMNTTRVSTSVLSITEIGDAA